MARELVAWDGTGDGACRSASRIAGFEVDRSGISAASRRRAWVVVQVLEKGLPTPTPTKLNVCRVTFARKARFQIVCGAANVRLARRCRSPSWVATCRAVRPDGSKRPAAASGAWPQRHDLFLKGAGLVNGLQLAFACRCAAGNGASGSAAPSASLASTGPGAGAVHSRQPPDGLSLLGIAGRSPP